MSSIQKVMKRRTQTDKDSESIILYDAENVEISIGTLALNTDLC